MSNRMSENDDFLEMKDISEYELALRTMRVAAHFAVPWNKTYVALENYMIGRKYFAEELQHDPNPGRTLCHFTDFVINENANHWRDARPQTKAQTPAAQQVVVAQSGKKKKHPFVDICPRWNVGKCAKLAGMCYTNGGVLLRHMCNWRDFALPNSQPCSQEEG